MAKQNNEITKFSVQHVQAQARKITGQRLTTWSDGTYIVVAAGEGPAGKAAAEQIAAATRLSVKVQTSAILGSVAELADKAARGLHDQSFLLIGRC